MISGMSFPGGYTGLFLFSFSAFWFMVLQRLKKMKKITKSEAASLSNNK